MSSLFVGDSPSIDAVGTLLLGTLLGLSVRSGLLCKCACLCSALTHASLAYKLQYLAKGNLQQAIGVDW